MTNQYPPVPDSEPCGLSRDAPHPRDLETFLDFARRMYVVQGEVRCTGLRPQEFNFCIATSSHVFGLPRKENPAGVASTLLALASHLDSHEWSSPQTRVRSLRRLFIAQLGSEGALDEHAFGDQLISIALPWVPRALRAVAPLYKRRVRRWALKSMADLCQAEPTHPMYFRAYRLARAVNVRDNSFVEVATDAASEAADAAAMMVDEMHMHARLDHAVCGAADTAIYGALSAGLASCGPGKSVDATVKAQFDRALSDYVDSVVSVLRALNAPGCEWLDLLENSRCFCPYGSAFETYDHLVLSPLAMERSVVR